MIDWRDTRDYRMWRAHVIRRDSRCVICDSIKNREAHHINHATYFIGQRFNVYNGVTMCAECHRQFHNNFKQSTKEKCTYVDFLNFKTLIKYIRGLV